MHFGVSPAGGVVGWSAGLVVGVVGSWVGSVVGVVMGFSGAISGIGEFSGLVFGVGEFFGTVGVGDPGGAPEPFGSDDVGVGSPTSTSPAPPLNAMHANDIDVTGVPEIIFWLRSHVIFTYGQQSPFPGTLCISPDTKASLSENASPTFSPLALTCWKNVPVYVPEHP